MDLLTEALGKMNLSEECYFEEDLSNEITFLEDAEKKIVKEFNNVTIGFYYAKKVITLSVELTVAPTSEIGKKLIYNVDSILD